MKNDRGVSTHPQKFNAGSHQDLDVFFPSSETGIADPLGTSPGGLISGKLNKSILLLFPIESNDILIMLCHYFSKTTTRKKNSKGHQTWNTAQNTAFGGWRENSRGRKERAQKYVECKERRK